MYYLWARLTGLKHSTGIIPTILLLNRIKKEKPDIVHIHCPYINTIHVPLLIKRLKEMNMKTVITNHAEFFYTGNCQYAFECLKFQTGCGNCEYVFDSHRKYLFDRTTYEWKQMKNAFENGTNFYMVGVSPWVVNRMLQSPISSQIRKIVILNGINTDIFNNITVKKIKHSNFILHVTAHFSNDPSDPKGGYYIIKLAEQLPNNLFVVAGTNTIVNGIQIPKNVVLLGSIKDRTILGEYYRKAKLMVVTSKSETFGMTCAESLCCGTPIVGFKSGGTESITIEEYSEFCDWGNLNKLKELVIKWENKKKLFDNISKVAIEKYSSKNMANKYKKLYDKLIEK